MTKPWVVMITNMIPNMITWVDMITASTTSKTSKSRGTPMLPTVGLTTRVRMLLMPSKGITKMSAWPKKLWEEDENLHLGCFPMPSVVVHRGHCFLPQLENYNLDRMDWSLTKRVVRPTRITQMRKNVLKTRMTSIGTCWYMLILQRIQEK